MKNFGSSGWVNAYELPVSSAPKIPLLLISDMNSTI